MKPFTFSDGTVVPQGTMISAAAGAMHHDPRYYPNPDHFDILRFAPDNAQIDIAKQKTVTTSSQYIAFGHGRHACPGRFFAVDELKAMFAHVLLAYDISLGAESNGCRPPDEWFGSFCIPNTKAQVRFKRRQV